MKTKTKFIAVGLGLAQLALFGVAQAQEVKSLDEVVVLATKNNQKQWQSGKVVSIIDSAQIARSSGKTVAELLNQQAGIQVLSSGATLGKDKSIFIRGAASAYTVVLIDGIPASDPSSIGSPFDLKLVSIDQVERIEILRGGQSTMYGSDAVAGVINIITKKKGSNDHLVNGVFSAGTYNTYKGSLGLSGNTDNFTYNIGYSHLQSKGFSEAIVPTGNTAIFDKDGSRNDAVNANFSLELEKGLSISPFLRYSEVKFDYDNDAFSDAPNTGVSKNFNGGAQAVYEFNQAKLTLNYSYQSTDRTYQSMFSGHYKGTTDIFDFYYNQNIGKKLNLLVGLDNRNTNVIYFSPTGNNTPSVSMLSAYASLYLHDLGVFNLEIGGRTNKHSKYGTNGTYTVTPSIVLGQNVKLFATASSSFRAPALDMLFGIYGANLNLKPEKSEQLEAGIDFRFLDKKLNLKTTFFKRSIKDAIVYGLSGYTNQDKQKAKGFEIEPSLTLEKFNIGTYYAFVEGETNNGTTIVKGLLRRPKFTYGVNAGVQLGQKFNLSANYKYTGKRNDTYFNMTTFTSEIKDLKAYGLLDVYAEYALVKKRLKLFVDLKNITNEKYTEIYGYSTMGFNSNVGVAFNF